MPLLGRAMAMIFPREFQKHHQFVDHQITLVKSSEEDVIDIYRLQMPILSMAPLILHDKHDLTNGSKNNKKILF